MLKARVEFSLKLDQNGSMLQDACMQRLVRTFAFMLVVLLAAAGAVFDAQTTAEAIQQDHNQTAQLEFITSAR